MKLVNAPFAMSAICISVGAYAPCADDGPTESLRQGIGKSGVTRQPVSTLFAHTELIVKYATAKTVLRHGPEGYS